MKLWKADELTKENLDFSFTYDLPLPEVMRVWYWELDRELGTVSEPFVTQAPPLKDISECPPAHDPHHRIALPLGLKNRKLGELIRKIKPYTDSLKSHWAPYSTIHAFEIDWTMPLPEISKAFDTWIKAQTAHQEWGKLNAVSLDLKPRGRQDFCDAWLNDLAVYRISCAELKFKDGTSLLNKLGIKLHFTSSNWSKAKHRSRQRLHIYKDWVESLPGWRDRVMPDSTLAWNMLKSFSRTTIDRERRSHRQKNQSQG